MDENIWKIAQVMMWLLGIQTSIILFVAGLFFSSVNKKIEKLDVKIEKLDEKLSKKIDKLDEKVTDIDRRVCRMEGALTNKDCCMLKDSRTKEKAE